MQRTELKNGETIVVIYFDSLDKNQACVDIKAYRSHEVADQKSASITIYDYYDNCKFFLYFFLMLSNTEITFSSTSSDCFL